MNLKTATIPNLGTASPGRKLVRFALLAAAGLSLCASSALAQYGHMNAGAVSPDAGVPLIWVNGAIFATNSGYVQPMTYSSSGTYAGYYNSGPTMTALPNSDANDSGGPSPFAASAGSFINVQITLLSAPEGGTFAFWEAESLTPTYVLEVGQTTDLIPLSDESLGAGLPGGDPYGHIHGRRFSADVLGDYILGFQLIDTSDLGPGATPIHTPSEMLYMQFTAVPEPGTMALMGVGILAWVSVTRFSRSRKSASVTA